MPHNWLVLSNTPPPWSEISSDPVKYRAAVKATVELYGGRFVDMFWAVGEGRSFVLVDGPADPSHAKAMLRALPSISMTTVLDVTETQKAYDLNNRKSAKG